MAVREWQPESSGAGPAPPPVRKSAGWLEELASLDAALRAADFTTTPDRWINAYDLLAHMLETGSLPRDCETASRHLAPLFCRNPIEQERFPAIFRDWWLRHDP